MCQSTVQWASKVIEVSSEYTELEYSARQVLLKPNVLPAGGTNPSAWRPFKPNDLEYIKVEFNLAMPIQQIAIGETYNPGSVTEVYAYNDKNKEVLVYQKKAAPVEESWRMFRIFIGRTDFNVKSLKIVFDGKGILGYSEIDCIGISNSKDPIEANINVLADVNSKIEVLRLNNDVNSKVREIKPLITKDEETLYFSRRGHPDNIGGTEDLEDIWYADIDSVNNDWGNAVNIGEPLNNPDPNFISAFLQEEEEYIILGNEYRPDAITMKYGISKSLRVDKDSWTYPQSLNIYNDINMAEKVNFWLTRDDEVLIISEEGKATEGERDLYVSFLQKDGHWTEPVHMGPIINTAGEEESPFLMPDKKTLIFSSNGHSGYGKVDLFMTRRLDNTWRNWTEPENLGPIINSELDDMFMYIPLDGSTGYFCREVEGNDLDIHSFSLPLVTEQLRLVTLCGEIKDPETLKPLDAEVVFSRLRDGVEVGRVRTDTEGNYCIELPADDIYTYRAEIPGYIPVGATIDLLDVEDLNIYAVSLDRLDIDNEQILEGAPIEVPENVMKAVAITLSLPELKRDTFEVLNAQRSELGLPVVSSNTIIQGVQSPVIKEVNAPVVPVQVGQTFIIKNIFFDVDKSTLKEESWLEMRNLAQFMNDYPKAIVELSGHTDSDGTDAYNADLSKRRVEAVQKGLSSLGVDNDRLRFVWYGESVPISPNSTAAGKALNRRVEFTILKLE
jgi:outer membrane protein OmpA-like peptidoglycan-associated protein